MPSNNDFAHQYQERMRLYYGTKEPEIYRYDVESLAVNTLVAAEKYETHEKFIDPWSTHKWQDGQIYLESPQRGRWDDWFIAEHINRKLLATV